MQGFPETQQMHKSRERHSRPYFKLFASVVGHRTESEGQVDYVCTWVNYLVSLRLSFSIHQRVHLVTVNMLSVCIPFFLFLGLQKNWGEGTRIVHISPSPLLDSLSHYHIPHQSDTFVTADGPTLKHDDHPKFIVCLMVSYGVVHSMDLGSSVMTCVHLWALSRVFSLL